LEELGGNKVQFFSCGSSFKTGFERGMVQLLDLLSLQPNDKDRGSSSLQVSLRYSHMEHREGLVWATIRWTFFLAFFSWCEILVDVSCPIPPCKKERHGFAHHFGLIGSWEWAKHEVLQEHDHCALYSFARNKMEATLWVFVGAQNSSYSWVERILCWSCKALGL
jgi:hypothetical protein